MEPKRGRDELPTKLALNYVFQRAVEEENSRDDRLYSSVTFVFLNHSPSQYLEKQLSSNIVKSAGLFRDGQIN